MKNQKIIMMVGPDRCGKTEISIALSKILGIPRFKASSEHASFLSSRLSKNDHFVNQLRFADPRVFDLFYQTGYSVIFDRAYPCEWVYSQVMNRETDQEMLDHIDKSWASLNTKIILCHRSSYSGIIDDLDPTINDKLLTDLHNMYFEFSKWTNCKLLKLNVDDEDLERELFEISSFVNENN